MATSLSVSISELPAVHVAYLDYTGNAEPGDLYNEIHKCFQRVQKWVQTLDIGRDHVPGQRGQPQTRR